MNTSVLEEIGLTESEAKVYLALLELGSSSTGPIVDKADVASSKIYELLEKLIQKGLASVVIKSGVKHFEAAPPKRILDYMHQKQKKLLNQEKELQQLIPELELKQTMSKDKSETLVFKGIKGAETAFADILQTLCKNDELLVLGFSDIQESFQRFIVKFHKKRAGKGINLRGMFGEELQWMREEISKTKCSKIKPLYREKNPVAILIYKDKVLFSIARDFLWIQIKNKGLADSMRLRFEKLWNQDTYILRGVDAVQSIFDEMLDYGHADFVGARGYLIDERPSFIDGWEKRAKQKGFTMRNVVDKSAKGHRITTFEFAETRYNIPKDFSFLSVFWIFGNKVIISNWIEKEPLVVVINNKQLYETYKKQFETLWCRKQNQDISP